MERGFRGKLSLSTANETKSLTVVMICSKSGKPNSKNPSIKGLCPFMLHYERRSFMMSQIHKQYANQNYANLEQIKLA